MYDLIEKLQARGFSNDIINLFELHEPYTRRRVFEKLMSMNDDEIARLNQTEATLRSMT